MLPLRRAQNIWFLVAAPPQLWAAISQLSLTQNLPNLSQQTKLLAGVPLNPKSGSDSQCWLQKSTLSVSNNKHSFLAAMLPKLWAEIAEPTFIQTSQTLFEYIDLLSGFLTHPKWGQNSNFWPSNVKLTSGCTSVPTRVVCLRKYKPSNRTTSRLLYCPNGKRLMLNTFNPRWRSNAAGGPIRSLREQVGLRPKLRCAPQKCWNPEISLLKIYYNERNPTRVKTLLKSSESPWSTRSNDC